MVADTNFRFEKHVTWDSPGMTFKNFSKRGRTKGYVPVPPIFLGVKCYFSNTLNVTDFKFDKHVPREMPHMTPLKFSEKRSWPGTYDPLNWGGVKC